MGCGHHGSLKVISHSFSPSISLHIPCPQHVDISRVGPLVLRNQTVLSSPGPFSLFIHQLRLCLRLCGCVESWGPSPFPHPSLSCPPTFCLLTWPRVMLGPDPQAPVCVCVIRPSPPRSDVLSVGSASVCVCQCR